ncbi:hypothetical protein [Desulfovibrio aminophilus]|uniref:hypothetical protein n=1 Tax=Desulfovibrio aminophilus TaxID=81425 RepID=UPI003392CE40
MFMGSFVDAGKFRREFARPVNIFPGAAVYPEFSNLDANSRKEGENSISWPVLFFDSDGIWEVIHGSGKQGGLKHSGDRVGKMFTRRKKSVVTPQACRRYWAPLPGRYALV